MEELHMQTISNEDMHVPARLWSDPVRVDPAAVVQAMRLCKLPFAVAAAFMPNLRPDTGFPTGTVFATDGYVIPHGLAPDLGCGLAAARTTASAERLTHHSSHRASPLRKILDELARQVPAGDGPGGSHTKPQVKSLNEIWSEVLPVPGFRHPVAPALAAAKDDLRHAMRDATHRLGTIGGGHHFLELLADDEDRVWIVAHSGSRGLGAAVCTLYDGVAAQLNERWHAWVPGRPPLPGPLTDRTEDLAFLPTDTGDGESFMKWVSFCLVYAAENRARLIRRAEELLFAALSGEREAYVDTPHNYVKLEHLDGRAVVVHRKAAARAEPGSLTCVAGSARSGSYVVEGLGDPTALSSCPHGYGRRPAGGDDAPPNFGGLAHPFHHLRPLGHHRA